MKKESIGCRYGIQAIEQERTKYPSPPDFLKREIVDAVSQFHHTVEGYQKTPLVSLHGLAQKFGVKKIYVKDEAHRFGLNAFKGLGGVYAISSILCDKLGLDISKLSFQELKKPEHLEKIKDMVFITATDGNHGKGVTWAAKKLGCKAYVYMPKGTVESRVKAIKDLGAEEVNVTDMGYDDTVRLAYERAKENGWYMVQDTAWEGYTEVPTSIVQGYTTLVKEIVEDLEQEGEVPTHVFLQAGVGAFAGGALGYLSHIYKENLPIVSIVEPEEIACIFESAKQNDGVPHKATGSGCTIMAGLNCGEPCLVTWPILRDFPQFYFSCPDIVTEKGMRLLGNPLEGDTKIVSGESGAVSAGLLACLLEEDGEEWRKRMKLTADSVIMLISTEGATDPENYDRILSK